MIYSRYGECLVIVASQTLRMRILLHHDTDQGIDLGGRLYCLLEKLGRYVTNILLKCGFPYFDVLTWLTAQFLPLISIDHADILFYIYWDVHIGFFLEQ